jgi:hypothetical protein
MAPSSLSRRVSESIEDDKDMPHQTKGEGEQGTGDEPDDDEFDLASIASKAYHLQQKDTAAGPDKLRNIRYNEPAPFQRRSPSIHAFRKHPFLKGKSRETSRKREPSTVNLRWDKGRGSTSEDYQTKDKGTPPDLSEHQSVDRIIRQLKKQLDPLNYTEFGFTGEQVQETLRFSNSVRKCIAQTGAFGHETDRLYRWLNIMVLEAREGPHRLEFELVKNAHLDKLVEEIVEFKSKPPTLPMKELKMIETASDLLRFWRHRFGNKYYLLDRQRQKELMDTFIDGLVYKTPTPATPTGWVPRNINCMSEREAESEFKEGQW